MERTAASTPSTSTPLETRPSGGSGGGGGGSRYDFIFFKSRLPTVKSNSWWTKNSIKRDKTNNEFVISFFLNIEEWDHLYHEILLIF